MRKIVLFLIILFQSRSLLSQDILLLKTGDSLKTRIIEVGINEITYKKFDSSASNPNYKILKSTVDAIIFSDGSIDNFSETTPKGKKTEHIDNYFMKGYADAKKYYRGYKTAATLTFVASLYSPIVGMIPAGACGFSSPEYQSLGFPDAELMKNSDYKFGYTNKAKKIKQQKVLKNWLIPTSIWVGAVAAIAIVLEGANLNWIP